MLQLQTSAIDICRISKLLVKHCIKASITNQSIILDGDISDELLSELCNGIDINAVQNFVCKSSIAIPKETSSTAGEKTVKEVSQVVDTLSKETTEYDLIYPVVKRGQIYLCDFGEPCGSEQALTRPAIIIQNDDGNLHSPTTIVVACTTEKKKKLPVHYHTHFGPQNVIDFGVGNLSGKENIILAEQIQTIDKRKLRKYLGTLNSDFMSKIDEKLYISLNLTQKVETVSVSNPETEKQENTIDIPERKDINLIQVQLLSFVDINELFKISQSFSSDEVKTKKFLELFGFDFKKKGVEYLLEAILISPKNSYFNLETLSESVSLKNGIDKEEIKRLIIARIKETLGFKKAPTMDFIRLINTFLLKQEANNEKTNI